MEPNDIAWEQRKGKDIVFEVKPGTLGMFQAISHIIEDVYIGHVVFNKADKSANFVEENNECQKKKVSSISNKDSLSKSTSEGTENFKNPKRHRKTHKKAPEVDVDSKT
jgi:hypothetical protein